MASLTRRAALLVAATLTAATLAACSSGSDDSMPGMDHNVTPMTSSSSATTDAARAGDVMFAQMMIPHHEQAIDMADMALAESSASAKVRSLATDIKKAQDPEVDTMKGWLTTWGASTAAPSGMDHGSGMMSDGDMDDLHAARGAAFDRMWLRMMITHHEGAITMAEQVLSTTKDAEVTKLAEAIIEAQKVEIDTMSKLI